MYRRLMGIKSLGFISCGVSRTDRLEGSQFSCRESRAGKVQKFRAIKYVKSRVDRFKELRALLHGVPTSRGRKLRSVCSVSRVTRV